MKRDLNKLMQTEIEKTKERNRVAAKKRRLKEKNMQYEKNKLYEKIIKENCKLKEKLNFLNHLKSLLEYEIAKYNCVNSNQTYNLIDDHSLILEDFGLDIMDEIIANELSFFN